MFAVQELCAYRPDDWPFAVIDGAAVPGLGGHLRVRQGAQSLFAAPADRELAAAAPYLVPWSPSASDELLPLVAGTAWGILVGTAANADAVRTHLRRFLSVRSPAGEIWYFRSYDPRVLPRFVAACNRTELGAVFGPIGSFGFPVADGSIQVLRFDPAVHENEGHRVRVGRLSGSRPALSSKLFQLRDDHLAAFAGQAEGALVERIIDHLRRNHPFQVGELADEVVRNRVAAGLVRARRLGARGENALTAVVALMFAVSPNFDDHPVIKRLLTIGDESADERILKLEHRTTLRNWEEARAAADPAAWLGSSVGTR